MCFHCKFTVLMNDKQQYSVWPLLIGWVQMKMVLGIFTPGILIRYGCVYDEHPLAGQEIQYRAPNSRSRYTTPFEQKYKTITSSPPMHPPIHRPIFRYGNPLPNITSTNHKHLASSFHNIPPNPLALLCKERGLAPNPNAIISQMMQLLNIQQ